MISFRRHFGRKVFVICLPYRILKKNLKIQRRHPFKLDFWLYNDTYNDCLWKWYEIWYELSRNGVKIIDF